MATVVSKKKILAEFRQCKKDCKYFIKTYAKIPHPIKGSIPFKLYDFQEDLLDSYQTHRKNVLLKSRQMGASTTTSAYIAWLMIFHQNKKIVIYSIDFDTAKKIVDKVKHVLESLPAFFREKIAKIRYNNITSLTMLNGSTVEAKASKDTAARGDAGSLLVLDEAAFIANIDTVWGALKPILSTGGSVIALSTPNGVGNWFHSTWEGANEKDPEKNNGWNPVKMHWKQHPEYDDAWFAEQIKDLSPRLVNQEYEMSFLASGQTIVEPVILEKIRTSIKEPYYTSGHDGNLWVWEDPIPSEDYIIGVDVARGDGKDYSAFHVLKCSTLEQVAEYKAQEQDQDIFANLLYRQGMLYGKALIAIENAQKGHDVCDKLNKLGYDNLYWHEKGTHDFVEHFIAETKDNCVMGFTNIQKTRTRIMNKFEELVHKLIKEDTPSSEVIIRSSRFHSELIHFIWSNTGKQEAQKGKNDDLVLAWAIAAWIRETALKNLTNNKAVQSKMLLSIKKVSKTMNTSIPGMVGFKSSEEAEVFKKDRQNIRKRNYLGIYRR